MKKVIQIVTALTMLTSFALAQATQPDFNARAKQIALANAEMQLKSTILEIAVVNEKMEILKAHVDDSGQFMVRNPGIAMSSIVASVIAAGTALGYVRYGSAFSGLMWSGMPSLILSLGWHTANRDRIFFADKIKELDMPALELLYKELVAQLPVLHKQLVEQTAQLQALKAQAN